MCNIYSVLSSSYPPILCSNSYLQALGVKSVGVKDATRPKF